MAAIAGLRRLGLAGHSLTEEALTRIAGVDVHPLAVLIARANFVIALGSDVREFQGTAAVPVYMADSLLRAEGRAIHERSIPVRVSDEHEFLVPAEMAEAPAALDDAITNLRAYAERAAHAPETEAGCREGLVSTFRGTPYERYGRLWIHNWQVLTRAVREGRDTIWEFILRNAYRPLYLAKHPFHLVVGNPPWLPYSSLRDKAYQEQVKNLALKVYRLLEGKDVNLFAQSDTATVFYAHCAETYKTAEGTIAFVMPRSVLTGAKQHRRFQQRGFSRVIDLEGVSPLFNVPACVVITEGSPSGPVAVPVVKLAGSLPEKNAPWSAASSHLAASVGEFKMLAEGEYSPYHTWFAEGASLYPRRFWFVVPPAAEEGGTLDPLHPYLQSDTALKGKPQWEHALVEGPVECEFLYASMLGADLLPFGWLRLRLVVLPALIGPSGSPVTVTGEEAWKRGCPGAGEWLGRAQEIWEKGKKPRSLAAVQDWVDYRRKLSAQKPAARHRVLYNRAGTYLACCVVGAPLNLPVARAHVAVGGFVADTDTFWYTAQSDVEAHYLCGVLNSALVDAAIKPYQTRGQWGQRDIRLRPFEVLPIPLFSEEDRRHLSLAEISQECHRKVAEIVPQLKGPIGRARSQVRAALQTEIVEIDSLVADMLGLAQTEKRGVRSRD